MKKVSITESFCMTLCVSGPDDDAGLWECRGGGGGRGGGRGHQDKSAEEWGQGTGRQEEGGCDKDSLLLS